MGISGLLPVLKSVTTPKHVGEYRGQRVAIDGFSWLHKGAYCCSRELCEGIYTDRFVRYCMSRVEMIRHHGVHPVVIFDGGRLPSKADEEDTRRRSRQENKMKALAHLAAGNTAAAEECFQRAVNVTSNMAKQFIDALKQAGIAFLVAPYEADAQMAYMAMQGDVHAVITEDSDLLVYGCPRVLYKLDKYGNGEEILLADLPKNQGVSFIGFTHDMFAMTCIMAGCDFLPSLPNIGLRKAHQLIKKFRDFVKVRWHRCNHRPVCKNLRFKGTSVPRDYEERLQRALWVFRHQRVYCPRAQTLVHVMPLPTGGIGAADVHVMSAVPKGDDALSLDFLGPMMDAETARGIALGDINAATRQPFDLASIYHGCARPPAGVADVLGGRTGVQHPSDSAAAASGSTSSARGQPASGCVSLHDLAVGRSAVVAPHARHPPAGAGTAGRSTSMPERGTIRSFFPATGPAAAAFVPPRAQAKLASTNGASNGHGSGSAPSLASNAFADLRFSSTTLVDVTNTTAGRPRPGEGLLRCLEQDTSERSRPAAPCASFGGSGSAHDACGALDVSLLDHAPSGRLDMTDTAGSDVGMVLPRRAQLSAAKGPLRTHGTGSGGVPPNQADTGAPSWEPASAAPIPSSPAGLSDPEHDAASPKGLELALPARPFQPRAHSPPGSTLVPSSSSSPAPGAGPPSSQLKRLRAGASTRALDAGVEASSPIVDCVPASGRRQHAKRRSLGGDRTLSAFFGAPQAGPLPSSSSASAPPSGRAERTADMVRTSVDRIKDSLAVLDASPVLGSAAGAPASQPAVVTVGRRPRHGLSKPHGPFSMFAAAGINTKGAPAQPADGALAGQRCDAFHSLDHVPRLNRIACGALDQLAEDRGLARDRSDAGDGPSLQPKLRPSSLGGLSQAHDAARKPFKPPRAAAGSGPRAATMDIRAFAFNKGQR